MCSSLESSKPSTVDVGERLHAKEKKHKRGFSFTAKLTGSSHDRYFLFMCFCLFEREWKGWLRNDLQFTCISLIACGKTVRSGNFSESFPTSFRWSRNHSNTTTNEKDRENSVRFLGTPVCPRMEEVAVIEPLICKKISHERLTGLIFREDCLVTACQEGFILTWARPGKVYKILLWSFIFAARISEEMKWIGDCFPENYLLCGSFYSITHIVCSSLYILDLLKYAFMETITITCFHWLVWCCIGGLTE